MDVVFYPNFQKRHNSTKIPTEQGQTFSGQMVEPFDMSSPSIRFSFAAGFAPYSYGFCYINSLGGRYYHVTEWTYESGFWICQLVCDVLGSGRDDIFNTSAFVMYSSSHYTSLIPDSRVSTFTNKIHSQQAANLFPSIWGSGCYAVTVIGSGGGTQTYILDYAGLGGLIDALSIADSTELDDQMEQLFAGASINSILTACWLPFPPAFAYGENPETTIKIANWDSGVSAHFSLLTTAAETEIVPSFGGAADYQKNSLYLSCEMWLPFIGKVAIPVDEILGTSSLQIRYTFDPSTANFIVVVSGNNGGKFSFSGKCGHTIPISAISVNPLQGIIDTTSATASAVGLNFGGAASQAFDAFQAFSIPTTSTVGNVDSKALIAGFDYSYNSFAAGTVVIDWFLTPLACTPADIAPVLGWPVMSVKNLGSMSGYVQTSGASVEWGFEAETQEINNLLDGGVYLE